MEEINALLSSVCFFFSLNISAPISIILSGAPPLLHMHFLIGLKWLL